MEYLSDPLFILAVLPAILIAGISKGGFGGGLGVVAVPLIALVIPVNTAAAIMLPILCCMDLFGLWAYRGKWNKGLLYILIPAAFIGILIGTLSFEYLHEANVRLIIGLIAVTFSAKYFRQKFNLFTNGHGPKPPGPMAGYFWGAVAGFTSFVAHAGGPPVGAYMLRLNLDKTVYQATTVFFFTFVNYVKLVPYAMIGQFDTSVMMTSLILLPLAPLGMLVGIKLHNRVSQARFYLICYTLLFITGLKLISDWMIYISKMI